MEEKVLLAGCVILDEVGKVLLIHRNRSNIIQWEIPGGKIEVLEKPEETAKREIGEELGIVVEIEQVLGREEFIQNLYKMDYIWFKAKIISGNIQLVEINTYDKICYFSWEALLGMEQDLSPNVQNLVKAYFEGKITI